MTPDEFRAHLARLGLSQVGAGRFLDYGARTVRRWAAGEPIPVVVQLLLVKLEPGDVEKWKAER